MKMLEINEQTVIDITTAAKDGENEARLQITENSKSPAILQIIIYEGQTAELHMTGSELEKIGELFQIKGKELRLEK